MKTFVLALALAASLLSGLQPASAAAASVLPAVQGPNGPVMADPTAIIGYDGGTQLPCVVGSAPTCLLATNSTFSGTVTTSTFAPTSATSNAALAVTTTSASVALPAGSTQIVQNIGTSTAFVSLTTGAGTATTVAYPIQPNTQISFAISGQTFLNAITASGTASLTVSGGSGIPALAGGTSSGGGGGGGAVTIASGADVIEGATADTLATNTVFGNLQAIKSGVGAVGDAACATDNGSCSVDGVTKRIAQRLTSLITALGTPMQQTGGSVSITGTLPAFASPPTIANTSFGISGTLPAFATAPTIANTSFASTIASGADVVEGATADTASTNTVFGNLQAIKAAAQDNTTKSPVKLADGDDATQGLTTDSACSTDNGTCTVESVAKRIAQRLTSLITAVGSPIQAGGMSGASFEVAASDNHQVIKNGSGTWYGFDAWSIHTAALFIRFYDAGTGFNGCNSATNLIWEGNIPASSTGNGLIRPFGDLGRVFTSGLSVCVTGAFGNTNTTAATASVSSVNVGYK